MRGFTCMRPGCTPACPCRRCMGCCGRTLANGDDVGVEAGRAVATGIAQGIGQAALLGLVAVVGIGAVVYVARR